ncbi:1,4-alpha-glucan branching enzyme [Bacillus lacus]|uniref:1,4-alpha-glucan branching enzyme GlgB n=1 Tax=Metabacillus lacus TaxID=1983721 RepID=A0A7X2LZ32_9BACI|nr:1,4-alpha-glucan branching enzyme [Metabacillus lacus]
MLLAVAPSNLDIHLFHEGNLFESYKTFGAHLQTINGISGTRFCVWAPHAREVRVVGDFNQWDGRRHILKTVGNKGIWGLFTEDVKEGDLYKYEIHTASGKVLLKSDPYAFYSETRPATASIVYSMEGYKWSDAKWQRKKRLKAVYDRPMSIYELHLASWRKKKDGSLYSYAELAETLIPYALQQGFTHIEILPLVEHPYDRSWGYQGTGYYSATSRYGTPHELMAFIDQCHQNDLGVILDWVPGHFCKDEHGLYMFDGQPLYDYQFPQDRENHVWGTANFDLGKHEVHSFLISNALFWMKYFHIDGFRVDAVSNMIYWPNSDESSVNQYALAFLKKLNKTVFHHDPGILMIAEDSTDWPGVTSPVHEGGLGFNYKWNMGWMNDVLQYMEAQHHQRKHLHDKISFSLLYAFSENFILPFSHDEVVHGKKSLLNKMPGDHWQKFAQLRLLLGFMIVHPGKKLLFMGSEFGQFDEWKDLEELDWGIKEEHEIHRKTSAYFLELMSTYKKQRALYELDHSPEGFEWIDVTNREQSIFSFIRKSKRDNELVVAVCNFTPRTYHSYKVGVPVNTKYIEILNSDSQQYGGSGQINKKEMTAIEESFHGRPFHIEMTIPPYGISILRAVRKRRKATC